LLVIGRKQNGKEHAMDSFGGVLFEWIAHKTGIKQSVGRRLMVLSTESISSIFNKIAYGSQKLLARREDGGKEGEGE
jgi:hypothetical protein